MNQTNNKKIDIDFTFETKEERLIEALQQLDVMEPETPPQSILKALEDAEIDKLYFQYLNEGVTPTVNGKPKDLKTDPYGINTFANMYVDENTQSKTSENNINNTDRPILSPEEEVTQRLIKIMEENSDENRLDWIKIGLQRQFNANGTPYNILNSMLLNRTIQEHDFDNTQWFTFKQVTARRGYVKKGQSATKILQVFPVFEKDEGGNFSYDENNDKIIKGFRKSSINVFNINQTSLPADPRFDIKPVEMPEEFELSNVTEHLIENFPVDINFRGDAAYYTPATNEITLPSKQLFTSDESLFSVLAHECAHATGHKDWLAREGVVEANTFDSEKYAKEELVAELASAMVCSNLSVPYKLEHHAGYLKHWVEILKQDPKFIFQAMNQAKSAASEIEKYATVSNTQTIQADNEEKLTTFNNLQTKISEDFMNMNADNIDQYLTEYKVDKETMINHLIMFSPNTVISVFGIAETSSRFNTQSLLDTLTKTKASVSTADDNKLAVVNQISAYIETNNSTGLPLVKNLQRYIASGYLDLLINSSESKLLEDQHISAVMKEAGVDVTKTQGQSR